MKWSLVKAGALSLAALLLAAPAGAAEGCRAGFDVGSSGLRVGSSANDGDAKISVDYLADVWADNKIDETVDATVEALRTLPALAHIPSDCAKVAGAYSAWRLAMAKGDPAQVAETLADIQRRSHVALFIIPQDVEGAYGYFAAKRVLGDRLRTPFILDEGGGSLQIASAQGGWGSALGQKAWRKLFCQAVKGEALPACTVNPVGGQAKDRSRAVLAADIAEAKATLGTGFAVTATSSPVVKGMYPVLHYLAVEIKLIAGTVDDDSFDRLALSSAIDLLSGLDDAGIVTLLDHCRDGQAHPICTPRFVATMVTDMILVDAIMQGLDLTRLHMAHAEITNVPGLIADDRAYAWAGKYACYLTRLRAQGVAAYTSDPNTCPHHH